MPIDTVGEPPEVRHEARVRVGRQRERLTGHDVAVLLAEPVELVLGETALEDAWAYMPGEAWPWKETWSPPPGWSAPRQKWLKPTS